MGRRTRQFGLLLWKNYVLQKRKVLLTLLEILLPAFFSLLLIFVRIKIDSTNITNATSWPSFNVDRLPNDLCPSSSMSFCDPWRLYFTPDNDRTRTIMSRVIDRLETSRISGIVGYSDEESMVKDILAEFENSTVTKSNILGGIVFKNLTPPSLSYHIRLSSAPRNGPQFSIFSSTDKNGWRTRFMFPQFQNVGPRENGSNTGGSPGYFREGFLALQSTIDRVVTDLYINMSSKPDNPALEDELSAIRVHMKREPYPPYLDDKFVIVLQMQLPFFILLSFIFPALNIVKDVVHEKERKLKESMKMMGLSNWLHWTAWFLKYLLFLFISILIMTIFFIIPIGAHGSVIGFTAPSVLVFFLFAYAVSTISFAFMISVFFSKANSAAAAGGILFFLSYIPYSFLQPRYDTLSWSAKMASCLISNVAMPYGALVISRFEGTAAGVQWHSINDGSSVDDTFALLHVIIMLFVDSFIYLVITFYVEAVFPGDYGVPQPWYFPVMPSYWCGGGRQQHMDDEDLFYDETMPLLRGRTYNTFNAGTNEFFEAEPVGINAGIKIRKLRKEFHGKTGKTVAVNDMTLNMYEGQITALLGHNGAGKTTTMSMLTGLLPPTNGAALVNGYDIRTEIHRVHDSLGICPQHDILFDNLTVREHLIFFTKLKGFPPVQVQQEVDEILAAIGLPGKQNARAKTLSGGMKRKLSVGIALCGGSKIVILDEPTSGMDPNARRGVWDILQKQRSAGRTLLLSTHFMDEADTLADRIAIMADGKVECMGTPLFLKNKYGAGYHLVLVKNQSGCDVEALTSLILSHVPSARLESNVSAELSFGLPHESKHTFQALFTELEKEKEMLGIASYGASITTMEEVFLKVGEGSMSDEVREKIQQGALGASSSTTTSTTVSTSYEPPVFSRAIIKKSGGALYLQQFKAMFIKRVLHTFRNLLLAVSQCLIPLIFVIMALIVVKTMPYPEDSPALDLNMRYFKDNTVVFRGANRTREKFLAAAFVGQYEHEPNIVTKDVNKQAGFVNKTVEDFLIYEAKRSLATYNSKYLIAADFSNNSERTDATALFNNQAYHTTGITLNALDTAILKYITNNSAATIRTVNHPLPRTVKEQVQDQMTSGLEGGVISFNMLFGMSFLASSFVVFLIKERTSKAKHIQFVSGVHNTTFWSATFVWDYINFLFPCLFLILAFVAFDVEAYVGGGRVWYVLLLLLLYGWAILPFMYVLSFLFTAPASGLVWLTMFNIISGIATVLAVDILMIPQLNTTEVAEGLQWGFLATMPNFCLGQGVVTLYNNYQYLNICTTPIIEFACLNNVSLPCCKGNCGTNCLDYNSNYLSWEEGGIGRFLVFLAIQGQIYFAILFLLESQVFQRLWYHVRHIAMSRQQQAYGGAAHPNSGLAAALVEEDADVTNERERIELTPIDQLIETDALILHELRKTYGQLTAVNRVSVGIQRNQCFGLLGINGAGKTSTFKMLTGDEMVSGGNAFLDGFSVRADLPEVQRRLGYCPQFDALIEQLTGRETLWLYARLRGVVEPLIPSVVNDLLAALMLRPYADALVQTYSGGTKRKLSTAVALVGDPPVIFLDEPTTGMDPVARRMLWDTLSQVRASGRTLVLTSHSMEECEALCTQIAIMVNGQFKCLGSIQHLKSRFGDGYTLIARVSHPPTGGPAPAGPPSVQALMDYIDKTFPGSVLKDIHQGSVHYYIPSVLSGGEEEGASAPLSLADLFGKMEAAREKLHIEDYLISQTSLEQVFINFARAQVPPTEVTVGCCAKMRSLCSLCCFGTGLCVGAACEDTCCACCCGAQEEEELVYVAQGPSSGAIPSAYSSGYQSIA